MVVERALLLHEPRRAANSLVVSLGIPQESGMKSNLLPLHSISKGAALHSWLAVVFEEPPRSWEGNQYA